MTLFSSIESLVQLEPRVLDWASLALPQTMPGAERLRKAIAAGFHGEMNWLADTVELRVHPKILRSFAHHAVLFLWKYPQPLPRSQDSAEINIAAYAQGEDYHHTLGKWIHEVINQLKATDSEFAAQSFVDSFPVMERELAVEAGLGWLGKNSLLLHRKHGSAFVLGGFLCNKEISKTGPHPPWQEFCGTCRCCIDACPTAAITEDRTVDARKCISYLTIEKRGDFSAQESKNLAGWLFGCDICQIACPWNHRHQQEPQNPFWPSTRTDWAYLLEPGYGLRSKLRGTALDRAGRKGLTRNFLSLLEQKKGPGKSET